jgi:hypothetical protein
MNPSRRHHPAGRRETVNRQPILVSSVTAPEEKPTPNNRITAMTEPVTFDRRKSSVDRRRSIRSIERRTGEETHEDILDFDKETWGGSYPDIDSPRLRNRNGRRRTDRWH